MVSEIGTKKEEGTVGVYGGRSGEDVIERNDIICLASIHPELSLSL